MQNSTSESVVIKPHRGHLFVFGAAAATGAAVSSSGTPQLSQKRASESVTT
jgi:hypothetical protein